MVRTHTCVLNINDSKITHKKPRFIYFYFITGLILRRGDRLP